MIHVELGPTEIEMARLVGSRRYHEARLLDQPSRWPGSNEELDINAAGAEIAACRAMGGWWSATAQPSLGLPDMIVGKTECQIRSSTYPTAFVPIYEEDDERMPFFFVTGTLPTFAVVGWILGYDAKLPHRWATTNPRNNEPLTKHCYLLEQHELTEV